MLVGAPKLNDFLPLTGEEFENQLKKPIMAAFKAGVPITEETMLQTGVMARIIRTIDQAAAEGSLMLHIILDLQERGLLDGEEAQQIIEPLRDALVAAKSTRGTFEKAVHEAIDE